MQAQGQHQDQYDIPIRPSVALPSTNSPPTCTAYACAATSSPTNTNLTSMSSFSSVASSIMNTDAIENNNDNNGNQYRNNTNTNDNHGDEPIPRRHDSSTVDATEMPQRPPMSPIPMETKAKIDASDFPVEKPFQIPDSFNSNEITANESSANELEQHNLHSIPLTVPATGHGQLEPKVDIDCHDMDNFDECDDDIESSEYDVDIDNDDNDYDSDNQKTPLDIWYKRVKNHDKEKLTQTVTTVENTVAETAVDGAYVDVTASPALPASESASRNSRRSCSPRPKQQRGQSLSRRSNHANNSSKSTGRRSRTGTNENQNQNENDDDEVASQRSSSTRKSRSRSHRRLRNNAPTRRLSGDSLSSTCSENIRSKSSQLNTSNHTWSSNPTTDGNNSIVPRKGPRSRSRRNIMKPMQDFVKSDDDAEVDDNIDLVPKKQSSLMDISEISKGRGDRQQQQRPNLYRQRSAPRLRRRNSRDKIEDDDDDDDLPVSPTLGRNERKQQQRPQLYKQRSVPRLRRRGSQEKLELDDEIENDEVDVSPKKPASWSDLSADHSPTNTTNNDNSGRRRGLSKQQSAPRLLMSRRRPAGNTNEIVSDDDIGGAPNPVPVSPSGTVASNGSSSRSRPRRARRQTSSDNNNKSNTYPHERSINSANSRSPSGRRSARESSRRAASMRDLMSTRTKSPSRKLSLRNLPAADRPPLTPTRTAKFGTLPKAESSAKKYPSKNGGGAPVPPAPPIDYVASVPGNFGLREHRSSSMKDLRTFDMRSSGHALSTKTTSSVKDINTGMRKQSSLRSLMEAELPASFKAVHINQKRSSTGDLSAISRSNKSKSTINTSNHKSFDLFLQVEERIKKKWSHRVTKADNNANESFPSNLLEKSQTGCRNEVFPPTVMITKLSSGDSPENEGKRSKSRSRRARRRNSNDSTNTASTHTSEDSGERLAEGRRRRHRQRRKEEESTINSRSKDNNQDGKSINNDSTNDLQKELMGVIQSPSSKMKRRGSLDAKKSDQEKYNKETGHNPMQNFLSHLLSPPSERNTIVSTANDGHDGVIAITDGKNRPRPRRRRSSMPLMSSSSSIPEEPTIRSEHSDIRSIFPDDMFASGESLAQPQKSTRKNKPIASSSVVEPKYFDYQVQLQEESRLDPMASFLGSLLGDTKPQGDDKQSNPLVDNVPRKSNNRRPRRRRRQALNLETSDDSTVDSDIRSTDVSNDGFDSSDDGLMEPNNATNTESKESVDNMHDQNISGTQNSAIVSGDPQSVMFQTKNDNDTTKGAFKVFDESERQDYDHSQTGSEDDDDYTLPIPALPFQ